MLVVGYYYDPCCQPLWELPLTNRICAFVGQFMVAAREDVSTGLLSVINQFRWSYIRLVIVESQCMNVNDWLQRL